MYGLSVQPPFWMQYHTLAPGDNTAKVLCYTPHMKHIARSTIIIAVFFGLEKILGFIRQVLIARTFKLSTELDAFNAANNIPDLLFALISGGALAMAFIPVLSETRENQGKVETWNLFSQITNFIFLVTAGLSMIVALLAGKFVRWEIGIAPGFAAEQQVLVTDLMRLNLIATLLFSLSGLVMAGLQAHQHFLFPAIAPSMYDVGTLFGVLVLAPQSPYQFGPFQLPAFDLGIHGLVYGVILGAALFLIVQIPALVHFGFQWSSDLQLGHPGVRKVLRLMGPRVLTVFFIQLIFITQDNLASRLVTGAVTALVYGWLFMQVPETLIGTALGTALLPTLSEQITRNDHEQFQITLEKSIRIILGLTLPLAVILSINLPPVIRLLDLDAAGSNLIIWTSRAYMAGLMGHALLEVAARAFYAQQNARTPLLASGLTWISFIGLGIPLSLWLGAPGIGLANSIAFSAEAALLFILLYRTIPQAPKLKSTLLRVLSASGIAAGLGLAGQRVFPIQNIPLLPSLAATTGLAILSGVIVLPFVLPEIRELLSIERASP